MVLWFFIPEPPDIKNWFSSYTYESPALDTSDEFRLSSYKKGKTKQAGLHFGMSLKSEEENGIGTTTTPYNEASIGKQMDSAGSVKTTSSVEEKRQDHKNWVSLVLFFVKYWYLYNGTAKKMIDYIRT